MFASRTSADVVRVDHFDFPNLVRKGWFLDLSRLAANDKSFRYDDYLPLAIEEARYKGGFYGLNQQFGAEIIYYNKRLVRRAGLEDPYSLYLKGGWTWEAFRRYAQAMTSFDPNGHPTAFGCAIPIFPMNVPVLWAFGGDLLQADGKHCRIGEPGVAKAYQFLADLRWRYRCAPTPAQEANSAFTFESGKLGMLLNWSGMTPRYRTIKSLDWDICPLPKGPFGGASMVKGNQLVVYRETRHPEAAWRLERFLTSRPVETELYINRRRNFPTRKDVAYSPEFLQTDLPPFHTRAFVQAVEGARPLPIDARWAEWSRELKNAEDDLYSGRERNAASSMASAARRIDAVLAGQEGF